ncbi:hypothetical protein [Nonomuraea zeae]|uniref:Uncharacterized protein n=1 Tax=Nonomuraea zeae TaxID=1642303 RepID=A0A5S4FRJ0_9ACTN|nr:hypothetical protein [Nonomuraea zeae]TMR23268.1 hypothetical protein ETD85_48170 [Nonomuraea zeae]
MGPDWATDDNDVLRGRRETRAGSVSPAWPGTGWTARNAQHTPITTGVGKRGVYGSRIKALTAVAADRRRLGRTRRSPGVGTFRHSGAGTRRVGRRGGVPAAVRDVDRRCVAACRARAVAAADATLQAGDLDTARRFAEMADRAARSEVQRARGHLARSRITFASSLNQEGCGAVGRGSGRGQQ